MSRKIHSARVDSQELYTNGAHNMTTSDGGHRITMQGTRKASKEASKLAIFALSLLYGLSSAGLTYSNKKVYVMFGEVSPMNLLMVQCLLNVTICFTLMTLKEINVTSFSTLKNYGVIVPELNKLTDKIALGLQVGLANVITVIFGMFATKLTPLPLFLAFRRSAILASITVVYLFNGERPTQSDTVATALLTTGAVVASLDGME